MKIEVFINGKRTLMTLRELKDALLENIGPWNGWIYIGMDGIVTIRSDTDEISYNNRQVESVRKREEFRKLYRQMRFAHSQVNIMSEHGVLERLRTHRALRDFCDKWTVPTIHDVIGSHMFYRTGNTYQRKAYDPWIAFQQWMQVN